MRHELHVEQGATYRNIINRSEMVLGAGAIDALAKVSVIIFGVGGVGSWCAEALVRTGVTHLTIVDSDTVCATNINRQAQATSLNVGASKVEEMKARLLSINPGASIRAVHAAYDERTCADFDLASYDYVIDAIDRLRDKVLLLGNGVRSGAAVFSSMGAGARSDPARVRVGLVSKTANCPLARRVRRLLRENGISADIPCVFSDELPSAPAAGPLPGTGEAARGDDREGPSSGHEAGPHGPGAMKKHVTGSLVQVTAVFGFTLAGMVIRDVSRKSGEGRTS